MPSTRLALALVLAALAAPLDALATPLTVIFPPNVGRRSSRQIVAPSVAIQKPPRIKPYPLPQNGRD